ncbi:MAG: DUF1343 domain-containing protein [Bacteroidales bacterium]
MVKTGLEIMLGDLPADVEMKHAGVVCHASSITSDFTHIIDHFYSNDNLKLAAIFGPQHGLFGQTQDNMIEWEGYIHPYYKVPVYSLYGEHRKPTPEMLDRLDVLVIDLQDVGARLYTYAWTLKLCMEACAEARKKVIVLDRPNPIAPLAFDGPVLKQEYFTFVGGAEIPLCHRMTIGEIAIWLKLKHVPSCDLKVIAMDGWNRSMLFTETNLPWVIPSPNMPTLNTAIVYPGMVLIEALNLSEGRGTTLPFELFGAPYIKGKTLISELNSRKLDGCKFRIHNFIPTFHKFSGQLCEGLQIHVTDPALFRPVDTAMEVFDAIIKTSGEGNMQFKNPPYEYEDKLMPFDILSGDDLMRKTLEKRGSLIVEKERWESEIKEFRKQFSMISIYDER